MGLFKRKHGSAPDGYNPIVLGPSPVTQYYYQEKQSWPWPNVPAHETQRALSNCWTGNQLPGATNFIPGVPKSWTQWNVPTSYANTLINQQFNVGLNIQNQTPVQSAALMQAIQQAWANRLGY